MSSSSSLSPPPVGATTLNSDYSVVDNDDGGGAAADHADNIEGINEQVGSSSSSNNNTTTQEGIMIRKQKIETLTTTTTTTQSDNNIIELMELAEKATLLRQTLGDIFDIFRETQKLQRLHLLAFGDEDDEDDDDDDDDDHNNNNNNEEEEEEEVPVVNPVRRQQQQQQQQQNLFSSLISSHIEVPFLSAISSFTPIVVNKALLMTMPNESNQRLPIHLACEYSAPISIIRKLLEYDTAKKSILAKDVWGDLPIHIACSRGPNYSEVVKLLLDADTTKQTINVKDCNDYMPIHMACRYYCCSSSSSNSSSSSSSASNIIPTTTRYNLSRAINTRREEEMQQQESCKTIQLLLNADKSKSTLLEEGIHGQYPIHILCRNESISTSVLKALLEADDQINGLLSVMKADDGDRIPIHVYLTSSCSRNTIIANNNNNNKWKLDILRVLLEGMIIGRINRHGLDNWKYQLTKLCLKTMKCAIKNERDLIVQDILHIINFTIHEILLERVFVMELICWKMNLLKLKLELELTTNATSTETNANATNTNADGLLSLSSLVSSQQRSQARIKSGADVIIREVLPFLEYEPIDTILTTLEKDFFPINT